MSIFKEQIFEGPEALATGPRVELGRGSGKDMVGSMLDRVVTVYEFMSYAN